MEEATDKFTKVEKLYETFGIEDELRANNLKSLGEILFHQGKYTEALSKLIKLEKLNQTQEIEKETGNDGDWYEPFRLNN